MIYALIYTLVLFHLFHIRKSNVISSRIALAGSLKKDITEVAVKYDVPANIIAAIVQIESAGNPAATGKSGERGLMQLTSPALRDVNDHFGTSFNFDEMYVAKLNLIAGTLYLKLQMKRFTLLSNAIRAYNAGERGARKFKSFNYFFRVRRYA